MFQRQRIWFWAVLIAMLAGPAGQVKADFLELPLSGTGMKIVLEGRVTKGRIVQLRHKFGKLYFDINEVGEIYEVPTNPLIFSRMTNQARVAKDADAMFAAAKWALRHALLPQFYQGVEQTLEIDPSHAAALKVKDLQEQFQQPLPETAEEEAEIRRFLDRDTFKIARSNHFILLHDTNELGEVSNVPGAGRRPPRARERLELLEQVYETFILTFAAEGIELEIPQKRLQVLLFSEFKDYSDFSQSLNPVLASAVGFWDPQQNVSVFYDNATDELYKTLQGIMDQLHEEKEKAKRSRSPQAKDIVRRTNTLQVLVSAAQERSDIKVVTHEATHQMAGNTGLLPRHVRIPSWAHEGLATYFEAPAEATWSGVGAVNEERLNMYRALAEDTEHSNIDFIATDQIFSFAASHGAKLHAYGQAWALTHFLMENHFEELMKYYALLAQMPPDVTLSPEVLREIFERAFGQDREAMTLEWRAYMQGLKTDFERVIADEKQN